jgi:hypothetical protein
VTTGEQRKAEGQAQAKKRAGNAWMDEALAKLKRYAYLTYINGNRDLTMDDFRANGGCPEPNNANAWGSLPKAGVRAGLLVPTDRVAKALRPTAQARTVRVWELNPMAVQRSPL